jgi:hypothetical protein
MAKQSDDFETKLAAEQRKGRKDRLENSPPIRFLPGGTFNQAREFKPTIIQGDTGGAPVRKAARR